MVPDNAIALVPALAFKQLKQHSRKRQQGCQLQGYGLPDSDEAGTTTLASCDLLRLDETSFSPSISHTVAPDSRLVHRCKYPHY